MSYPAIKILLLVARQDVLLIRAENLLDPDKFS